LFPAAAVAEPEFKVDGAGTLTELRRVPGGHEVTVTAADGDAYAVANAVAVNVDGMPILLAQADTGSAAPAASTTATSSPTTDPTVLDELAKLRAQYAAIKAAKDADGKMLLWAALIAGVLKVLLSVINLIWRKPKKWLAWVAMGTAVPIALLSHYAAGNGWMDSLIVAGGGPGAILFNELLKLFAKAPTAEPAKA
jgi:hypothetical protein